MSDPTAHDPSLETVAAFLAVADRGGFAAAARELGVTQSTVSRRIAALEAHAGAHLVMRTTRRVALTEAGATSARELREVLAGLRDAHARVAKRDAEPEGLVRLTMPTGLGRTRVIPIIAALRARHPRLSFDLDLSDRYVDMLDGSQDIAVRLSDVARSGLQVEQVGRVGVDLYAAPAYLDAHGRPDTPEALSSHTVLALRTYTTRTEWKVQWRGRTMTLQITPAITATDMSALRSLTEAAAGIAALPDYLLEDELRRGGLEQVLPDLVFAPIAVYLVHLPHRAEITKVQTVLQALRTGLGGA